MDEEETRYAATCELERVGKPTSFQEPILPSQSYLPKYVSIAITLNAKHEFYEQHDQWTKVLIHEIDDPPLSLPCVAEEDLFDDEKRNPRSYRRLFSVLAHVEEDPEVRGKLVALIIRKARLAVLGSKVSREEEGHNERIRCKMTKLHEVNFVVFGDQEESNINLGMLPTDVRALEGLEVVKFDSDDYGEDCCAICLEKLSCFEAAARMPCSHLFHDGCIRKWLAKSHYCPICRFEMPTAGRVVLN